MNKMVMWLVGLVMALALVGCGTEARDRPQDCRENEYFNEGRSRCLTCPAVTEPVCRPGCEAEVVADTRGCPLMRCEQGCEGCDEDEIWDDEEEICEPRHEA